MSEKVLGFREKGTKKQTEVDIFWQVEKEDLVPVVSVEWLEKYVNHIRGCFEKNQPSDFEAGEETRRIEGLEVLLAEARKESEKQGGGKKK